MEAEMSRNEKMNLVSRLLKQQLVVAAPSVAEVQIEVRTGSMVRPDALMAYKIPELFGDFIIEWSFDVPAQMYSAFQENLTEAERILGTTAVTDTSIMPSGVKYLGTYLVLSGGASEGGEYRTLWGFANYSAFDAFHVKETDVASQFAQALKLLTSSFDRSKRTACTVIIYQRAVGLRGSWVVPPKGKGGGKKTGKAKAGVQ
jgi:hypothetical protein